MPKKKATRRRLLTFEDVRAVALSMPEVEETTAWGMPTFKTGKSIFAIQPHPRRDVDPNSVGVPVSFERRAQLLDSRPDVYYLTDHWAKSPGVLVRLSSIGRGELREILSAAWQHVMERNSARKARAKAKARARRGRR